jgi:[ribosomal protein S18]-alanine N-acetyltransferase
MSGKPGLAQADLVFRAMASGDIDSVLNLEHGTSTAPHWSRDGYEACIGEHGGSLQYFGIVAELRGRLAGFAVVRHLAVEARSGVEMGNECELESIVVEANLRQKGIGSRLLAAVAAESSARRATRLMLEVRESNVAAIGLYQQAGLKVDGRRPAYYADPVEDAVLMSLDLED